MSGDFYMTGATADEVWPLVRDFHYSKRMPSAIKHCFAWRESGGLFGDFGMPQAVITYSQPVSKNLPADSVELTRLVRRECFNGTLSSFLSWSLRWLRANTQIPFVLSYADTTQNHHGGVYQASGFIYVGSFESGHIGYEAPNKSFIHRRSCNARFGSSSTKEIARIKPDWLPVYGKPKHLYIFPLRQRLKSILRQRAWRQLPYPKPDNAACLSDALSPDSVSREHTPEAAPHSRLLRRRGHG